MVIHCVFAEFVERRVEEDVSMRRVGVDEVEWCFAGPDDGDRAGDQRGVVPVLE